MKRLTEQSRGTNVNSLGYDSTEQPTASELALEGVVAAEGALELVLEIGQESFLLLLEIHHPDIGFVLADGEINGLSIGREIRAIASALAVIEAHQQRRVAAVERDLANIETSIRRKYAEVYLPAIGAPAAGSCHRAEHGWRHENVFQSTLRRDHSQRVICALIRNELSV